MSAHDDARREGDAAWTADDMRELGHRHAALESEDIGSLEPLLATLVDDPLYEFHPCGRVLRGAALARRYYAYFYEHFQPMRAGFAFIEEWASADSLAQEYDVSLRVDGGVETHRVLGILVRGDHRLAGERIFASDRFFRLLMGDQVEPRRDFIEKHALDVKELDI